ncbi:MAG: arsenic resistance N-acetyltransferase ArsN2 [Bacillota bacterium]
MKNCCGGGSTQVCCPATGDDAIKAQVRQQYTKALEMVQGGCCSSAPTGQLYSTQETRGLPAGAVQASFGCGNPTALAALRPGEVVLDLGSGAGIDVFLAARRVGPTGHVYGLDMTDAMLETARAQQKEAGITNVTFLKGEIESLPFAQDTFDVVISNCVINLSPDKRQVFREVGRVLKPGGRFAVTDVVLTKPLSSAMRDDPQLWSQCVAGALRVDEYRQYLEDAGMEAVSVEELYDCGAQIHEPGVILSAFVRARKPGPPPPYVIRPACPGDLRDIEELLALLGLPTDGVSSHIANFLVADGGAILGVAGVEHHGDFALLRSVAVSPGLKQWGLGTRLVGTMLKKLQATGTRAVYLLTMGAASFFTRFGFTSAQRHEAPTAIRNSPEFAVICPESAQCMVLEF